MADVVIRIDGLQAPDKNTTRFYLNNLSDEWVCECSNKDFSKLQAIVLKQKYKTRAAPYSSTSPGLDSRKSDFSYHAGQALTVNVNDKNSKHSISTTKLVIFAILVVTVIFSCTSPDTTKPSAPVMAAPQAEKKQSILYQLTHGSNPKAESVQASGEISVSKTIPEITTPLRKMISDDVFTPYTRSQYGKTFAKFGSRMPDVEKARQASAFLSAASGKCTRVEMSEVATNSTRENIQTFTDCRNENTKTSERFRFQEAELKDKNGRFFTEISVVSADKANTVQELVMSKDTALTICHETVIGNAKFPSSVDFSTFGSVVNTSQGSGETWVEMDFDAKNELGAMLPYKAKCGFPIHGKHTFSVTKR